MSREAPVIEHQASRLRHAALPLVMIVFAVWGATVIPGWQWQMNSDGVSYLSVARKYLAGDVVGAVNAYWSPLYSWLLAILIRAGIEQLLATKVLAVVVGEAILAIVWWLSAHLGLPRDTRFLVCLTLCPILIYFGMTVTSPDLLMTAAVLLYLAQATSAGAVGRWQDRAVTGALGGLAYLAKAYALHFVLLHYSVSALADMLGHRGAWRRVAGAVVAGYLGFVLVAGAWVACLTAKYGHLTTGSVGQFSLAWNGPGFRIPMFSQGFLAPSDASAVSVWDDATALRFERWNPLGSAADRAHFRRNLARNWREIVAVGQSFTLLFWPIVVAGIVSLFVAGDAALRRSGFVVLTALLLFPIGYSLLHVHARFLSLTCVLLLVVGAWAGATMLRGVRHGPALRLVATASLCASFLYVPGWREKAARPGEAGTEHALGVELGRAFGRWSVARGWNSERHIALMADALRGTIPAGSRVASGNHWDPSLYLSHHLGLRYWGVPAPGTTAPQIRADLAAHGIEYFWFWGDASGFPFAASWQKIRLRDFPGFHLYQVPSDTGSAPNARQRVRGGDGS